MDLASCVSQPGDLRILVVDDEPMLRSVIDEFLDLLGFQNRLSAGDGQEALSVIREQPVDCMISDIRMPKMELEELLPILRQEAPQISVIATSGYSDFESARNIFARGAHDFLGKPLNLDALEVALNWVVERRTMLQGAAQLFGREALAEPPCPPDERLDCLEGILEANARQFQPLIRHAIRMARLARALQTGLDPADALDLATAAYLHEIGASYQMVMICRQPRSLNDDELQLVQAHSLIAGRMIAQALDRARFRIVIGGHLKRPEGFPPESPSDSTDVLLAQWLQALNIVDGWLQNRPDRPATTLGRLRETLGRRHQHQPQPALGRLLEQWPVVEHCYA